LEEDCYPMLDEPTDHLDSRGRELVARYLRKTDRGFLLVSHDRAFLDQCVDHILALNKTGQELVKGDFSTWYKGECRTGTAGSGRKISVFVEISSAYRLRQSGLRFGLTGWRPPKREAETLV